MKQVTINISKNILLVILTILMILLTVVIWIRSLSWEDIPVESGLGQLYMRMAYGSASVFGLRTEEIPAAYPIEIAVRIDDTMVGAQNDESSIDALYEQFQDQISSAFSDTNIKIQAGQENAYREAMSHNCIYFRYQDPLPTNLLFRWLSESTSGTADILATSFLLSSNGEVWIRDGDGALYFFFADIDSSEWNERIGESIFRSCTFLFESEKEYALYPETLIFQTRKQSYSLIKSAEPNYLESSSSSNLQIVLEAFLYNASVGNYMDGSTRIFVNNNSTLRVSDDGTIQFSVTSLEGGMEAYQKSEVTNDSEMLLRVDAAKTIIEQIQKSYSTDASFYLSSVYQDPDSSRIQMQFRYLCNGIPVMGEIGRCASIEFLENTLVSATIYARTFLSTEQQQYLIPCKQFVHMAEQEDRFASIGYFAADDILLPQRYFERAV